jgi:hypothetical protein
MAKFESRNEGASSDVFFGNLDDLLPIGGTIKGVFAVGAAVKIVPQIIKDLFAPGGKLIGEAGRTKGVQVIEGGRPAIESLFLEGAQQGRLIDHPTYKGLYIDLGNDAFIGFRESKQFGPTIDLKVPGLDLDKIHIK